MSARAVLRGLARVSRQAAIEGTEGSTVGGSSAEQAIASSVTKRGAHTEISAKYSPSPFARTKPLDRSAAWVSKNPYFESWVYRRDK
jgi:hypothetical protein